MPELPEVETVRRGLVPHLENRCLTRVVVRRADLRKPFPERFAERLEGRRVMRVGRRAKYLLLELDDGATLIWHLGMSGRVRIHPDRRQAPAPKAHDHVDLETDGGALVRFNDARRFGLMDLASPGTLEAHPLLTDLGPEPLGNALSGPALAERLAARSGPIKTVLLDQSVVAGLGNIYVCEALFRAGLSPRRKASTVKGKRAERLAGAVRDVLEEAIAAGGSSLRDHRQTDGELGYFQHSFAVYGREGEACPGCDCDASKGGIRRINQGGRSTFYCPSRQR